MAAVDETLLAQLSARLRQAMAEGYYGHLEIHFRAGRPTLLHEHRTVLLIPGQDDTAQQSLLEAP